MPDVLQLRTDLLTALRTLPDVGARIYDNGVPDDLPEAGGFIRPYVAVWTGLGTDMPGERDLTGLYDIGVLDWRPTTTCVAADAATCLAVAVQVQRLLTNHPLAGGWLAPDVDSFRVERPMRDETITPSRMYLPLQWRLTTT